MGNKQDKPVREPTPKRTERNSVISTPFQTPPRISEESFTKFFVCINQLPFRLSEEELDTVVYDVEERKYSQGAVIIQEGTESPGIFIIVKGACLLYASDGLTPIKILEEGQFFGEVSIFYKRQCTATIKCSDKSDCTLVMLSRMRAIELITTSREPFNISLLDWFKKNRYLDVGDALPFGSTTSTLIKSSMLETALFHNWSNESLDRVLSSLPDMPIELYPDGSFIYVEEDLDENAYLVLSGQVELVCMDDTFETFNGAYCGSLIGEESLFIDSSRSCGAKAVGPCQVVPISSSSLQNIFENDPNELAHLMSQNKKWKAFVEARNANPVKSSLGLSEIEILQLQLDKFDFFGKATAGFIHLFALSVVVKQKYPGHVVARKHNIEDLLIFVFEGILYIEKSASSDTDSFDMMKYGQGDVISISHELPTDVMLIAEEAALVGIVCKSVVNDCLSSYPTTELELQTVIEIGN